MSGVATARQAVPRYWRLTLGSAGAYLFVALATGFIVHQISGLTAIWPCNAITLALLLVRGERQDARVAILSGAFLGSILSSVLRSQPWSLCLLFPVANTLESMIAAAIIARLGGVAGPFDRVVDVIKLIVAAMLAPLVSAMIGASAIHLARGTLLWTGLLNWYGAAMLGLAVITPAIVIGLKFRDWQDAAGPPRWRLLEAGLVLGLVGAVAIIVFYLSAFYLGNVPLLFAILPCVTLATFRTRQLGAVASILIVTLIGAQATVGGYGPIARAGLNEAQDLIFLQVFVAMTFLSALPIAAALSERDARAAEVRTLADHFRSVVEGVDKVIFRLDRRGRWTYLNPAWEQVTGHAIAATLGQPWTGHARIDSAGELEQWAEPVLSGEVESTARLIRFDTADNGVRWMEMSFRALRDASGGTIGATGTLRDVHDRKQMEDHVLLAKRHAEERAHEAAQLAATDELTGLANRRAFNRHLDRHLEMAATQDGRLAVAIFDVDHFKQVNDRDGHAVGDRVLQRVAARAMAVVRSGDVVGRLGGEEFGVLMPGASLEDAHAAAERLREAIQAPSADGDEVLPTVTVSIGVAAARTSETAATVLQEADRALYGAKSGGRNRVRIAA